MSSAEVRKDKTIAFLTNPPNERKQTRNRLARQTCSQLYRTTEWNK